MTVTATRSSNNGMGSNLHVNHTIWKSSLPLLYQFEVTYHIFLSRIKSGEATKNIAAEKFNIRHWKRVGIMVTKFEKRKPFKFLLLSLTRISPSQTVVAIFNGRCNPLVTKPLVMIYVIYSLDYVTRRRIIRFWIVLEKMTLKTRLNLR